MPHCYVCKNTLDKSWFSADKSRASGVASKCRACASLARKGRRHSAKIKQFKRVLGMAV
jgi:hypothetical protein